MKKKPLFITLLAALSMSATPALAQREPERPVVEAAIGAEPARRLEAARYFRSAYPSFVPDMYSQLKAAYPRLEHGLVDAVLATWKEHPAEGVRIAEKVKERFGQRMVTLRTAVREDLTAHYPNFETRLRRVLEQHGPVSRSRAFLESYDSEALSSARAEVRAQPGFEGWYPGKFRERFLAARSGGNPNFDKLKGLVASNPGLFVNLAERLVEKTRTSSPRLAEDLAREMVSNHGALVKALQAEFPGGGDRVVAVVEETDPSLWSEVARFVRTETQSVRADLRANLENELPGFEETMRATISQRYPDLQQQLLTILRG